MAIPASPKEGGTNTLELLFQVYDNSGANAAALFSAARTRTVNGEKFGELAVGAAGVATATTPSGGVDVAATAQGTQVLAANTARQFAVFTNDSDTVIYLHLCAVGAGVVTSKGIRLNPNGGGYEINMANLYTGTVTAIHGGTGSKRLCVVEG